MSNIIQLHDITKKYDDLLAVDHISFEIQSGEIFGLLGPNGAGKTTTIKILTGLARPSSGRASINLIDIIKHPKKSQQFMGVVPDESNLYPELTGYDNLVFCAALYGMPREKRRQRALELLEMFDLAQAAQRDFATYSKGMKRKLTLAAGIIHNPPILFLDEPTTGIDVTSARQIRQLILGLRESGVTILLTTHYIEEAERLCDRIGFIVNGRIIQIDSVENLLQPIQNIDMLEITLSEFNIYQMKKIIHTFPRMKIESLPNGRLRFADTGTIQLSAVVNQIEQHGMTVLEARRHKPSLEDVFVRVTGIEKQEMINNKEQKGKKS
jgi:ABC-2 type transport system ATP-binding protein